MCSHASDSRICSSINRLKLPRYLWIRLETKARSTKWLVCLSGFNISLRAPFDCQEEVGGWESFLHGVNKAIRIFGFFEFLFKSQQIVFRKIHGGIRVKGSSNLAMSRDNNRRF